MRKTYIIDCYNLIHADSELKKLSESFGMERARADLLAALSDFATRNNYECVAVFDGTVTGPSVAGVRVVSSRQRSADDIIREQARLHGRRLVVVSSDLEIIGTARGNMATVIKSHDFASSLNFNPAPTKEMRAHVRPHRIAELREKSEKPRNPSDDDIDEWKKLFGA